MTTATRRVKIAPNYETTAWKWMRYSGILLIPLAWGHLFLQDIIVGVHAIDTDYVALRWGIAFWQIYDIALLGFAFAHGMNGLRQVINDFVHNRMVMRSISIVLFLFWVALTSIGALAALIGTQRVLAG